MSESVKVAQLYAEFNSKGLKETQNSLLGVKNTLGSIKGLLATVVGGFTIKKLASDFVNAAKTAENYRTSIRAVSSSIKEADATFDRIRSWAEVNPVDTDEAIGAFVKLKTAAVDNCEEALKSVADLSTVMQRDMRDISDAIVSARAISLRQLGILLDQTGKKAVIESNGIRKEVEKDIGSIRRGIIEVMKEAYGSSMNKARDTYQGILDTMSGMWTGFKQKVMEGAGGPFDTLKNKVMAVRDEWEKFTETEKFDRLVEQIQSRLVSAIDAADKAMRTLGAAINLAYEHAELLKATLAAIVAYKAGMLAMSVATSSFVGNIMAWVSLAPTAIKSMAGFQSWISLIGASIGPAGILAAAVGAGVFLELKDQAKRAENQAKRTREEIERVNKEFANASAEQITEEINNVTQELEDLEVQAKKTFDELMRLSTERFLKGGNISAAVRAATDPQLAAANKEIERLKVRLGELQKMEKSANPGKAKNKNADTSDSKGKSAAEKLVENIRDQIKYMGKDANSFLPILDKWLAKLKPLSEDWKKVKDLVNDIYGISIQEDANKADYVLDRIEREKQAAAEQVEIMKNANSEYLSDLAWRNAQALLSDEDYFSQTKALWEETKANLEAQGLDMSNLFNWPPEAREQFETLQNSAMNVVRPALEELRRQYDDGKLSLQLYIDKVRELISTYNGMPLVVKEGAEAIKTATNEAKKGIINLNDLTKQWIQDFQSGIANAIVDGESFADTLTNIGKEIQKIIIKLLLFGQGGDAGGGFGGLFGGFLKMLGLHSGGIVGVDAPTFTRQVKLPKFHSGGIVGAKEELAVLKKGEGVFTEGQMKAIGKMGSVGKIEVNVDVNNSGNGNMTEKQAEELGRSIREVVKAEVNNSLYEAARAGVLRTA